MKSLNRRSKLELAALVRAKYAEIWPDPAKWSKDELIRELAPMP